MDDARDDACQRIAVRHERIIEPGTIECEICWKAFRAYNAGMREAKLVVVKSFGSRAEAQLAKGCGLWLRTPMTRGRQARLPGAIDHAPTEKLRPQALRRRG